MPYPAGHRDAGSQEDRRQRPPPVQSEWIRKRLRRFHHGQRRLTRGGFYSYFDSKSDLYAEVMRCFFTDPDWEHKWEGVEFDPAADAGPQIVRAYLSRHHFDDVENSCPLVALPNDVARSDETVKAAFETVFKAMVALLGRDVRNSSQSREKTAMAISALCIGGMVLSRSINDRALGEKLRDAATNVALELGGWTAKKRKRSA